MRDDTTGQSVVFKDLFGKLVVARFDHPDSSSDGGALLPKACDERLGLTDALTRCLHDGRQQWKVEHSFHDLVRHGHYDTWCYLPTAGFIQFDDEPEQYLFAYVLRPGNANAKLGAIGMLRRVLERLRRAFPKAKVLVRLDGGFVGPEMFEFLEAERVEYVV